MKNPKLAKSSVPDDKFQKNTKQLPTGRLWLFRFIAIFIIPIIFFLLLEITLRVFNFGYPTSALIEINDGDKILVQNNNEFSKRFFPHKLAQEFVPVRFEAEKPEDVIRIFILGGSAAQGIPDPAYSFSRILNVMLKIKYPYNKFEIIPLAMTAINSHVVLEIANDCTEYDPDLFIVYLGNNEVVGPYGPGTMLTPIISNKFLLNLTIQIKKTRISQLVTKVFEQLNFTSSPFKKWEGMEMFTQNSVPKNDPRLRIAYNNFSSNLKSLNQLCEDNEVKIIYNTVASNLKDCPPFNSKHRSDISDSDLGNWEKLYSEGIEFEKNDKYDLAISKYLAAYKIDNEYADLAYRLGKNYWLTEKFKESKKYFILARENDCNRFRADSNINEIIRECSSENSGNIFLSNVLSAMDKLSPHGTIGNEFLFEHVHMNFQGNYIIANTLLSQIELIYKDDLENKNLDKSFEVSESSCKEYLAYNEYENYRITELVLNGFIKQPPFTNQLYHEETVNSLELYLDGLKNVIKNQDIDNTYNSFMYAFEKNPDDWFIHNKLADFLSEAKIGKYQEALNHYQFVMNKIPHDPNIIVKYGVVLAKLGKFKEAINYFQHSLRITPTLANAYYNMGLIYQKEKK